MLLLPQKATINDLVARAIPFSKREQRLAGIRVSLIFCDFRRGTAAGYAGLFLNQWAGYGGWVSC
jgi:hypothetical protein